MKFLKQIFSRIRRRAYGKNTIVMLIGLENTILSAYSSAGNARTINIPNIDPEFLGKYRSFLNQFKGWDVILLLDQDSAHDHGKIRTETLPLLDSAFTLRNPIKDFAIASADANSIIAYTKSHRFNEDGIVTKNITINHLKPNARLLEIISFIYNFGFPLVGIYLIPMEIIGMIESISPSSKLSEPNKFIIFIIPTLASGIRIFTLDRGVIYSTQTIPYPHGKSADYIAGLIKESVEDAVSKHKKYISANSLTTEIISLSSPECAEALAKEVLKLTWYNLSWADAKRKLSFQNFGDELMIYHLQLISPASNAALRQINYLEMLSSKFLNSLIVIASVVLIYTGFLQYKILVAENNLKALSNEYYKLSEEYREARKKVQNVENLNGIYDIVSDLAILKVPMPESIAITKHIFTIKKDNANINSLLWKLTNENIGSISSSLTMNLAYESSIENKNLIEQDIEEYRSNLAKIFPNYDISFSEINQNITNIHGKTVVPVSFIIDGPKEQNDE